MSKLFSGYCISNFQKSVDFLQSYSKNENGSSFWRHIEDQVSGDSSYKLEVKMSVVFCCFVVVEMADIGGDCPMPLYL